VNNNDQYAEIQKLAKEATATWNTKKSAEIHISKLQFMRSSLPNNITLRKYFDDLVCHVKAASGHTRNKEHWMYFVERDLVTLEWEFNHTEQDNDNI
jgi:hypothetical protein